MGEDGIGGRASLGADDGERENFHRSARAGPCPPPADTPHALPVVMTSQVTPSLHDFGGALGLSCLRRGLRLKDGPGSARGITVSIWAEVRMNPQGKVRVRANTEETAGTRAMSTWRTVQAGARAPVPPVYGSGRPAFSPPTVLRGRGRIFPAPARGEPRAPWLACH